MIGRDAYLNAYRVLLSRLSRGRSAQSLIVTGLRGVGKTVLLNLFADAARDNKWVVIELEASKHDEARFRSALASNLRVALFELSPRERWSDRFHRAAAAIGSFGLTVKEDGSVSGTWGFEAREGLADRGDLALDLTDVLLALGEAAKERERGVVLLIDEVQFLSRHQLEALIQAIHKTVQKRLPVTFSGAGLPQIAELAGDAKSYAERLFTFSALTSLEAEDARHAFSEPARVEGVTFEEGALDLAVSITQGYPYFIQELGYQAWELAEGTSITADDVRLAQDAYEAKLDGSFFRVRLDRTTPLQTSYLRAMAKLGSEPQKAADVARVLGRTSSQVSPTRAELINMGLLFTPQHGYAAFTVPNFDQFMLRAVPVLEVPSPRRRTKASPDPSRGETAAESTRIVRGD